MLDLCADVSGSNLFLTAAWICLGWSLSLMDTKINIRKGTKGIKTSRNKEQHLRQEKRPQFQDSDFSISWQLNIPKTPAYGIWISQLVRYARICNDKREFKAQNKLLSTKLEKQGFKKKILEKTFVKAYRSHYDEHLSRNLERPKLFGWGCWHIVSFSFKCYICICFC